VLRPISIYFAASAVSSNLGMAHVSHISIAPSSVLWKNRPSIMIDQQDFKYGFHCVALLDILGQRRKLRKLPRAPKEDEETRKLLAETAGHVLRFRDNLQTFVEQYQIEGPILEGLAVEARERIKAAKQSIRSRTFSDLIILDVSLAGDDEQFAPMVGVFGVLAGCCLLQGGALAEKRPIRGGIDVGAGLNLNQNNNEVYGPALEHAHYLESELSDYPRILVGAELVNYLGSLARMEVPVGHNPMVKELANKCLRFLLRDGDGFWMLDFLGDQIAKLSKRDIRGKLFKRILEYISEQQDEAAAGQNDKQASRYFRLRRYVESRTGLWIES
jgi:hypothetical protein